MASAPPANAHLQNCGAAGFYAKAAPRGHWSSVAPAVWAGVPNEHECATPLRRTMVPIVVS